MSSAEPVQPATGLKELTAYYTLQFFVFFGLLGLFVNHIKDWDSATVLLIGSAWISYPLFYLLPAVVISLAIRHFSRRAGAAPWRRRVLLTGAFAYCVLGGFWLMLNAALLQNFGFQFNGLVWNLLTTPGGFASMGLRRETLVSLSLIIAGIVAFQIGLLAAAVYWKGLRELIWRLFGSYRKYLVAVLLLGLFFVSFFCYSYASYVGNPRPLSAADDIPFFLSSSMRNFYRGLGVKQPDRELISLERNLKKYKGGLKYPLVPIERDPARKKYNIVWLACESWRAGMVTPEIMPTVNAFAADAVSFKRNYSGGNGTRQGVFTMFYGLYGNYWDPFLKSRRGPLFIDWLLEDGYDFSCITSAKFSYPEFDKTVFSAVPTAALYSYDQDLSWMRDRLNVTRLVDFLKSPARKDKPFFAFMFFESPHAPYEFPPDAEIRKDYMSKLDYTRLRRAEDGPKIFNRYVNANHHLDQQLGRVLAALKETGLLEDTIVVLVGDHGEEFYEKGYLGHNSTFVNEQVMTPLIIRIPGVKPQVYSGLSSHLDIVPVLAPFLGVKNPPADYSLGFNLLDPAVKRAYAVMAGWSDVSFVSEKYKADLPQTSLGALKMKITDNDDRPVGSPDQFFKENKDVLFQIQREIVRFLE
ncbi:MAG: sulfatase-like hydrolase/transferase [Victivallaceae bacterium]